MTYNKLFKVLDEEKDNEGLSIIDGCIMKYGKVDTIEAIDYISYFMTNRTFKQMTYWYSGEVKTNRYLAIQFLSAYLAKKLNSKCFEYLATR